MILCKRWKGAANVKGGIRNLSLNTLLELSATELFFTSLDAVNVVQIVNVAVAVEVFAHLRVSIPTEQDQRGRRALSLRAIRCRR